MMIFFSLTKLKTKTIVFHNVLQASDPTTLEELTELSSKRKAIEDSTNDKSHVTEAIAREISGGLTSHCQQDIQKMEQYLPLLENLVRQVKSQGLDRQMNAFTSGLQIRWSSALTSSFIFHVMGPKYYQVNDLYFELGMSLFLYGAMLRERALEVLTSDLVESATLFRKAAGVYRFLAEEILSEFTHTGCAEEKPPEATTRVPKILSFICLAEGQAVTARKAEEDNRTAGVLAKLHYGITEFLVEAIGFLQDTSSKGCKDSSSRLLDYALSCKALHELKCYKYTGDGLKNDGKMGAAIGVLRRALANTKKNMPKEETWRSVYKQAVDEVTVLLRKYERENDFVWHEKIPCNDELPFPQGVKIVTLIPYQCQKRETKLAFKSVR